MRVGNVLVMDRIFCKTLYCDHNVVVVVVVLKGFIGYAPEVYKMVTSSELGNSDDDQLFYTKIFLDENLRKKWGIKLDNKAEIFQNLNGAVGKLISWLFVGLFGVCVRLIFNLINFYIMF